MRSFHAFASVRTATPRNTPHAYMHRVHVWWWISTAIIILACVTRTCDAHGGHAETSEYTERHFNASWTVYEDDDDVMFVNFTFSAPGGWISVGFQRESEEYDYVLGYFKDNKAVIGDCYFNLKTNQDTDLQGKYDILNPSVTYEHDITIAKFTRKLNTGDKYDYNFEEEKGKTLSLKWKYGKIETGFAGDCDDTKSISIDFGEGTIDFSKGAKGTNEGDETTQLKAHGIIMSLVVMVLMISGSVLSRYLKNIFAWWFYAHAAIFTLSILFITLAAVVIFKAHDNKFEPGWHSVLGLFFIMGMGIQTLLGLTAHFKFDKKRTAPPLFPDKTHWFLGRTMVFLGVLTVLLGLYVLPAGRLAKTAFYAWGVVCFFLLLALEKHLGQQHEVYAKGIAEDDDVFDEDLEEFYAPKKGSNISHRNNSKQASSMLLCKLLCPAGFAILILYVLVAVGIGTSEF